VSLAASRRVGDRTVTIFMTVTLILFAALVGMIVYLIIAQDGYSSRVVAQVAAAQRASDHRWCTAVNLLTSTPVSPPADPAKNPSRVATYKQYLAFLNMKTAFGC
jgi:hypothetical protein